MSTGTDEKFKNSIFEAYLTLLKLDSGTPSPEFKQYINFSGGKTSLKDFRGKFVFIDLWATLCVNCWVELPYLAQLQREYRGENIIFLAFRWMKIPLNGKRP